MIINYLKRKFGTEAEPTHYSPLRIGLHSSITVTPVDLLVIEENLHHVFDYPSGLLTVDAALGIDLDPDQIYRFYCHDEANQFFMLQVHCKTNPRLNEEYVEEIMFFNLAKEEPFTDKLEFGAKTVTFEASTYEREWESNELFEFHERGVSIEGPVTQDSYQMLYARPIDMQRGAIKEYYMTGVEVAESGDEVVLHYIGYQLPQQAIKIQ